MHLNKNAIRANINLIYNNFFLIECSGKAFEDEIKEYKFWCRMSLNTINPRIRHQKIKKKLKNDSRVGHVRIAFA